MAESRYSKFKNRYTNKESEGGSGGSGGSGSQAKDNKPKVSREEYLNILRGQAYSSDRTGESMQGFSQLGDPTGGQTDTQPQLTEMEYRERYEPESRTEAGVREGRDYETGLLEQLLKEAQQNALKASGEVESANLDFEESKLARGRVQYGGDATRNPETGRLEGYREAGFGIFDGAMDPETLKAADLYNRRMAAKKLREEEAESAYTRLDFLREAVASGMSPAEIKQRLYGDMDRQDQEAAKIQEEMGLAYRTNLRRKVPRNVGVEQDPYEDGVPSTYTSTTGPYARRARQLELERKASEDFLSMLPETDDFIHEIEPLPESSVMEMPPVSPEMTDDDYLMEYSDLLPQSAVSIDETQSVTNPIDPIKVASMERELARGGGSSVADNQRDTGRN